MAQSGSRGGPYQLSFFFSQSVSSLPSTDRGRLIEVENLGSDLLLVAAEIGGAALAFDAKDENAGALVRAVRRPANAG